MRLLINRRVRHDALFPMLVMPLSPSGPSGLRPRIKQRNQVTSKQANLCWKCLWERFEPTFPGPPRGEVPAFTEQATERSHLSSWLCENGQQFMDRTQMTYDHDHHRFQKQTI